MHFPKTSWYFLGKRLVVSHRAQKAQSLNQLCRGLHVSPDQRFTVRDADIRLAWYDLEFSNSHWHFLWQTECQTRIYRRCKIFAIPECTRTLSCWRVIKYFFFLQESWYTLDYSTKNIQPLRWRIDILAFNANFPGEQSYLVLARKAYRPEDLGAIISFWSLKYTTTWLERACSLEGIFRSAWAGKERGGCAGALRRASWMKRKWRALKRGQLAGLAMENEEELECA